MSVFILPCIYWWLAFRSFLIAPKFFLASCHGLISWKWLHSYCICLLNLSPFILSYHFMFVSRRKSSPSPPHITPPGYVLVPLNTKTKSVLSQLNSHKILQPASSFPTSITSRHISDYNDNNSPSGILPSINKGKYASTSSRDRFGGSYDCVLDGCGYGEYIQQQHGLPPPLAAFLSRTQWGGIGQQHALAIVYHHHHNNILLVNTFNNSMDWAPPSPRFCQEGNEGASVDNMFWWL